MDVMEHDARAVRGERPFVLTNCLTGDGLAEVIDQISPVVQLYRPASPIAP